MTFTVRFRQSARGEFNRCAAAFGPTFEAEALAWLRLLADDVERNADELSVDAIQMLEDAAGVRRASLTARRWWNVELAQKLAAVWAFLRDRASPWQFRMAEGVFQVRNPGGPIPADVPVVVTVFFEVDRPGRQIVITTFRIPLGRE